MIIDSWDVDACIHAGWRNDYTRELIANSFSNGQYKVNENIGATSALLEAMT